MNRILSFVLLTFLIGLDQVSKYLVEQHLPFQQREPLFPLLSMFRTYNTGIAFSGFDFVGNQVLTIVIIAIIAIVLMMWWRLGKGRAFSHLGFSFIVAGAIGNVVDRVVLGHVVDFIQFHTQNWSFAVFNLADSFITIGAVLIIIDEIRQARRSNQE